MKKHLHKTILIITILTLLYPVFLTAGNPVAAQKTSSHDGSSLTSVPPDVDLSGLEVVDTRPIISNDLPGSLKESATYFVLLEDPAIPSYQGGIPGYQPTSPDGNGGNKLDQTEAQIAAYSDYLDNIQSDLINQIENTLRRTVEIKYRYKFALNGIAIKMSAPEAAQVTQLPGVKKVEIDQAHLLVTDVSPEWIGATAIWDGSATVGPGTKGEGIIIGVIDTGVNMDHPSFAAMGDDGYQHINPNGTGNYLGWCDDGNPNYDPTYLCNDKLIGAWDYADGSWAEEDDGPNDSDGHGSHTASTTAGNYISEAVLYGPTTSYTDSISGIAPHANLIVYDVCFERCYDTDVVAAVEQAILDGVDVINESIAIGGDTFTGNKQTAYLNAVSAGIFYARAAGNEGPNPATVGPEPPWTLSTAALTHNRRINNFLVDLTGGENPPADMTGEGFTEGYGPAPIVYAGDYTDDLVTGATDENARLCAMGNGDDMIFETPFLPGTFDGEIVVCDRGDYPRVEKGANVLESGAGGFVLADDGNGIVSDPHYLPGVHISQGDGEALKNWLDPAILQTASITGYTLDFSSTNGDVMAGFSSRGPGNQDFIKPDAGAPGVSIWAAYADNPGGADEGEEFNLLGGTSMASPHVAGSAALLMAAHPDWTPAEIKSALMSTSTDENTVKEDGSTPTDPFDTGAGRIQVDQAAKAGLLFDISLAAYGAADEANAAQLNLASFANDNCVGSCSWTRSVSNATGQTETWYSSTSNPEGILFLVDPISFTLASEGTQTFTVTATVSDTTAENWYFGSVTLSPESAGIPDSTLPVAVFASSGKNPAVLNKEVDLSAVDMGGTLNYTLTIGNPSPRPASYNLVDTVPEHALYMDGSAWGGLTYQPSLDALTWQGEMEAGTIEVQGPESEPFFELSAIAEPAPFPTSPDEGAWLITGLDYWYLGKHYTEAIWSVNGTLEAGAASGYAAGYQNLPMPDQTLPNNLLAPWWSDIDFSDGGEWYVATVTDSTYLYDVFEWKNAPRFGMAGRQTATFQIWIRRGTDTIWFWYDAISTLWKNATVGVEDATGTAGVQVYYNQTGDKPSSAERLSVVFTPPDPIMMGFSVEADGRAGSTIINEAILTDQDNLSTSSQTITQIISDFNVFLPLILHSPEPPN